MKHEDEQRMKHEDDEIQWSRYGSLDLAQLSRYWARQERKRMLKMVANLFKRSK